MHRGGACIFAAALIAPWPAQAAGGAHVVDDSATETPGACHIESWVSRSGHGRWLVTLAPACTARTLPGVELGAAISYEGDDGSQPRVDGNGLLSLTPKITLRSEERGVGVGLSGTFSLGLERGTAEGAAIVVPVTIPVAPGWRVNLNAGWQWDRATSRHNVLVGGQLEFGVTPRLTLMVESFARDSGKAGAQGGARWTSRDGRVDIDLLAGRYLDGSTPSALTLGLTIRR